ncbi:type IV pilin protein [Ectothiorhodospira lacustris]|uniref:type IV pilin protein n=1 Tax=Ectothiorhodospira lacustris TaxID=2899127 RepID=UPI001EE8DA16|nr:type IV pilin protein [Ectothiorhodospira lacustris]MCG5509817.1 prepilin-type N-terminal cleavage/methylation domain-containing protein [Ectothiorhodospira lacustris]MCG5521070.1 prepilin-type N-terminal cleavage/methylation domain-containing protein [Ectothiorhodospira lacustris]
MKLKSTAKAIAGFTLIEVMIVVVIIGILASISYPSYVRYVERTQATDGKVALLDAAQRLERCYTTQLSYAGCTIPGESPEGFYKITSATPSATTFTVTATGQAGRVLSYCSSMTINQAGVRTPDECW